MEEEAAGIGVLMQENKNTEIYEIFWHPSVYVMFGFPALGLDYVSHEDILPYNSTEQVPIQHELFERFLMYNPSKCKHISAQKFTFMQVFICV